MLNIIDAVFFHAELNRALARQNHARIPCRKEFTNAKQNLPRLRLNQIRKNCNRQHRNLSTSSIQRPMRLCHNGSDRVLTESRTVVPSHRQMQKIFDVPLWPLDR